MMKILFLTTHHLWYDTRLYDKLTHSLLKKDISIHLLTGHPFSDTSITLKNNFTYEIVHTKFKRIGLILSLFFRGLKIKPDIVICIEPLTMIAGLLLKMRQNCRVIYDAHEYYAEAFSERHKGFYRSYLFFEKFLASKMDAVLAVNEILLKLFAPHSFLCANYPNRESFSQDMSPEKEYDVIYAGCLWFERGLKIYLETANYFKQNQKSFKLLLIGSFKNKTTKEYYYSYVLQNGLEDYIVYKPYMPNAEVLQEMKSARIGVFFGDTNSSPRYDKSISMKILEYLSQKMPIVVNKLGMLGDFVALSQGGWIIDYDSHTLFLLLSEILQNEALLLEKATKGYDYVSQNAVWENQEETLYKAVFGE